MGHVLFFLISHSDFHICCHETMNSLGQPLAKKEQLKKFHLLRHFCFQYNGGRQTEVSDVTFFLAGAMYLRNIPCHRILKKKHLCFDLDQNCCPHYTLGYCRYYHRTVSTSVFVYHGIARQKYNTTIVGWKLRRLFANKRAIFCQAGDCWLYF